MSMASVIEILTKKEILTDSNQKKLGIRCSISSD